MKKIKVGLLVAFVAVLSLNIWARQPLSFEERVKAQEALERVYYNHRIWPKENPQPKPPFEKMVSKEQIEAKVTDYLKKSTALEKFWQRPIIASQLQAEMDRMAKGSKDPQTLNDLFAALNDDPYIIAECLARPVLADRLIRNWYANDERFHKETREKAEEALKHLTPENFCGYPEGQYSKMTYKLDIEGKEERDILSPEDHSIKLDEKEFEKMLSEIPEEGKVSGVIKKDDCFVIIHTAEKNEGEIVLEGVGFKKVSVDEWLKKQDLSESVLQEDSRASFFLPPMTNSACFEGWDEGVANAPDSRSKHSTIWTGTEMIIWGGQNYGYFNTGGRYSPSTDSWVTTSTWTDVASARMSHTAVWTGTLMIVWGGIGSSGTYLCDGGMYDPSSDSWTPITDTNVPNGRYLHSAFWTGTEMLIWGGSNGGPLNTGGRYNPSTDSWKTTSMGTNCPSARNCHSAVWTGTKMIVWGGCGMSNLTNTGGIYNPSSDSWATTSTGTNCPAARYCHSAIWTGTKMIIWGGYDGSVYYNSGAMYDPVTDSWMPTSVSGTTPSGREYHTAVWTGSAMVVWGGFNGEYLNTGGKYDPSYDSWLSTSIGANCPSARDGHTAVWTGAEMIVWGGEYPLTCTGGRYNPSTDSWVPTMAPSNPPAGRVNQTAVWTGTEMVIWGGDISGDMGGRYNPATDSWSPTSTGANVPSARTEHTAVWTGSEMIIWGGWSSGMGGPTNTGGRYNPLTDTWTATSTTQDAPEARFNHTAVWTGSEMLVWGGMHSNYLNNGGRYNVTGGNWTPISTGTNCPDARYEHIAIWTGSEMIVWGGWSGSGAKNTGGRYSPSSDSWISTSTGSNVPTSRMAPTSVWTGSEMIIWGGSSGSPPYGLNSGGRYSPSSDTWTPTWNNYFCPDMRSGHSTVWTGTEMVVWGGRIMNTPEYNSGGVYDPTSDTWRPTVIGDHTPIGRTFHSAVWTGSEMIIWGGMKGTGRLDSGGVYYIPYAPSDLANITITDIEGCVDNGVSINWSAPSNWGDNESGARTYDVLRDSTVLASGLSEAIHSYIDNSGPNNVSCFYQVRANNGCGQSTTTTGASAMDFVCTWNILYSTHGSFSQITGDGDSYFEKGEKWSIQVTVTNSGNTPATNVTAELSGNGITVCNNPGVFGKISAGGSAMYTYEFLISSTFSPCGGPVNFNVANKSCVEKTPAGSDESNLFSINIGQVSAGVPTDLVLQPSTADSYVNQQATTTNYGTATAMYVQAKTGQARRSLVQFDISSIPSGSTINSATLELYATAVSGSQTLNVHRITGIWTEADVTWNTIPTFTSSADASITGGTGAGWRTWNVASVVQSWANGTNTNYGFLVKGQSETGLTATTYTFATREHTTTTYHPLLRINYTPPASWNCDYVGIGECLVPLPGEAAPGNTYENGQMWSGDKTAHSWPALAGATGYKLYRGIQSNLQYLLTGDNDSCLKYQGADNSISLSGDDPSTVEGRLFWYLIIGTNGSGDGTAGNASTGSRIVNSTGSCP
jgi:hypothetical protein